ncbi:hypothetical protein N2152v2_006258 [Parachlorella kessleri]
MDPDQPTSSFWLPFASWLQQQCSNQEDGSRRSSDQLHSPQQAALRRPSPAAGASARGACGAPSQQRALLRGGHSTVSDCRGEQRMLEGYVHARQEMSVALNAPGLPVHSAPVVTAKQATALLRAISEPLVSLEVGRLTRKLSSPAKLQPTQDRGMLSLWLLPNDDLTLTWQATLPVAASEQPQAAGLDARPGGAVGAAAAEHVSCSMTVWEAIAHFPEHSFLECDEPVAIIHTLRNDASQRSFYIKPRADILAGSAADSAGAEAECDMLPQGTSLPPRFYFWLRGHDLAQAMHALGKLKSYLRRPQSLAKRAGVPQRKLAEIGNWLFSMERALAQQATAARHTTSGELVSRDEAGTDGGSRSRRSSCDGSRGSSDGRAAACSAGSTEQPQRSLTAPSSLLPAVLLGGPAGGSEAGSGAALASTRMGAALSSVVASCYAIPLAGMASSLSQAAYPAGLPAGAQVALASQGGSRQPSGPGPSGAQPVPMSLTAASEAGQGEVHAAVGIAEGAPAAPEATAAAAPAAASSTVSASASALYMDRRFNLMAPVAVTVVATTLLQSDLAAAATLRGDDGGHGSEQQQGLAVLQKEAVEVASSAAQHTAQSTLESIGRRVMEEQLAEAVLSTIRAGRSSRGQRAVRALLREREQQEQRRWQAAAAMPAIRAAAARAGQQDRSQLPRPAAPAVVAVQPVLAAPVTVASLVPCTPAAGITGPLPARVVPLGLPACESGVSASPAMLAHAMVMAGPVAVMPAADAVMPAATAACMAADDSDGVVRVVLPCYATAAKPPAAAAAAPAVAASVVPPLAPPPKVDCQLCPPSVPGVKPSDGKVTLENLQGLLNSAAPVTPNVGSSDSSGHVDCGRVSCSLDGQCTAPLKQQAGCNAGVEGPCKAPSLVEPVKGMEDGKGGSPRRVSFSGLFQLMNGCLDL